MEHGVNVEVIAIVAAGIALWGLVAARAERLDITAPIAFLVLGLLVTNEPLSLVSVAPSSSTVREIVEITLAFVLFSDASRVNVRALRADAAIPARLLLVGLPLTVVLGWVVALAVFAGIDPWVAAVIAAAVAPTDAALGAPIMEDRRIPARVRRILNVESGLNDGLATPIVTFLIAGAATAVDVQGAPSVASALGDLAVGALVGLGAGLLGGWLLERAMAAGWASLAFRPVAVLGIALFAYAAALDAGGNGFIAAFVGGMALGSVTRERLDEALELTTDAGALGSVLVWFIFGALLVPSLEHDSWKAFAYALLSLTVVRIVPVALSLVRTGLDRATVGVIGWFGPRGLASIVFGILAADALDRGDARTVLAAVSMVILLSVVAHGLSARPIAGWYTRRVRGLSDDRPEHGRTADLRTRRFVRSRRPPRPDG